jgi:hypothetical protein
MEEFVFYVLKREHHFKRTFQHCEFVKKYLQKIIDSPSFVVPFDKTILENEKFNHDFSKKTEPELSTYIDLSWFYKMKKEGKKCKEISKQKIDEAILHHYKHNKHHPEFWCKTDNLLEQNSNLDCSLMPLEYIACMVADWLAMSEENKSDINNWIKQTIGIRWNFTEKQVNLINQIIEKIKE